MSEVTQIIEAIHLGHGVVVFQEVGLAAFPEAAQTRLEDCREKSVLVAEVEVDRPIGHPGGLGHVAHPGPVEPVGGERLGGASQDLIVTVGAGLAGTDHRGSPWDGLGTASAK